MLPNFLAVAEFVPRSCEEPRRGADDRRQWVRIPFCTTQPASERFVKGKNSADTVGPGTCPCVYPGPWRTDEHKRTRRRRIV